MPGAADETPRPIASLGGAATSDGMAAYQDNRIHFEHLCQFIGLSERDFRVLKENKPILDRIIDGVAPQVYSHLLNFPHTREGLLAPSRHRPQKTGPDGDPSTGYSELLAERTKKFAVFLKQLTSWPGHDLPGLQKLMNGMSMVHHKHVNISLSHLILSLGAVQNLILTALTQASDLIQDQLALSSAVSKLLWLQSDAFVSTYHHYHDFKKNSIAATPVSSQPPIRETSEKSNATEDEEVHNEADEDDEPLTAPTDADICPSSRHT